jgi:carboxypeptidase Q
MGHRITPFIIMLGLFLITLPSAAQGRGGRGGGRGAGGGAPAQPVVMSDQTVIGRIWNEGMTEKSQAATLAQVLLDSIGPRLTGSPGMEAASRWVIAKYQSWGIPARAEQYGTWAAWRRGPTHIDLIAPRVRTLEGMMLAWSPGTNGRPVEGDVVLLPEAADSTAFKAWLPNVRGKFVLTSAPRLSCRMAAQWEEFGTPASIAKLEADQMAVGQAWQARTRAAGSGATLHTRLQQAGAAGVIGMNWSQYPGINKIFGSPSQRVPTLDLSCEDYGLVFRLAQNNQGPRIRLTAESQSLGERPVFNTIAEIKGSEKPNAYVLLSAHFDSWDGSSGATDNGTGTITMMEAMRILKTVYPRPKRTIVVGHWSGEEQGLNGSRAFSEDHPEIVSGLQALFNQDNGTGRVVNLSPAGLAGAGPVLMRYLQQIPSQITGNINFRGPGAPSGGGSDNASFICYGAPSFSLGALGWDYSNTTWHTNRDTYDKVVIDDLRNNATLTAMLAYLASEDPQTMPRDKAVNPATGEPINWTTCSKATRKSTDSNR